MTIGGNDLAFSSIVRTCLTVLTNAVECRRLIESARGQINDTGPNGFRGRLAETLRKVAAEARRTKPRAKVVLAGYPDLVGDIDLTI